MKFIFETYCGLYCGACPVLHANRDGNVSKISKEWNIPEEKLHCSGCKKSDTNAVYCTNCEIKACAVEKGVEFCFDCNDYPCDYLKDLQGDEASHHSIVFKNMDAIKTDGLEKWLSDQEKRWSCPDCGKKVTWYDEKCPDCGNDLFNCVDEEKEL